MTIVLDTNALVRLFGPRSPLHPLKQALLAGRLTIAVSTPVLLEYEEVVCRYANRVCSRITGVAGGSSGDAAASRAR